MKNSNGKTGGFTISDFDVQLKNIIVRILRYFGEKIKQLLKKETNRSERRRVVLPIGILRFY